VRTGQRRGRLNTTRRRPGSVLRAPLQYSDHQIGRGSEFYAKARELSLEGIISKRPDASYYPGDRGLWVKVKCQNREEFVGGRLDRSRRHASVARALLLAYYDLDGRLTYARRVGTGIGQAELGRLWRRLQSLATSEMPLDKAPPRSNRFGSPLVLSRVHWVRPERVVEVKYLRWTEDNLLRQVVYEGLREDKDPTDVQRPVPNQPSSAGGRSLKVGLPNIAPSSDGEDTSPGRNLTCRRFIEGPRGGTESSNPSPSSGESATNPELQGIAQGDRWFESVSLQR
jgi:ATP-dependent DNA ligase